MRKAPTLFHGLRSRRPSSSRSQDSAAPASTTTAGQVRSASSTITQSMLARIMELRKLTKEKDELREVVMSLFDRGAVVEPGELHLEIRETESRRLSVKSLRPILGGARVAELQNAVELTRTRQLINN